MCKMLESRLLMLPHHEQQAPAVSACTLASDTAPPAKLARTHGCGLLSDHPAWSVP